MAVTYLYGIFLPADHFDYDNLPPDRQWAMRLGKRRAIREASRFRGTVRRMSIPEHGSWDRTTFIDCSEQIWPIEDEHA